MEEIFHYCCPPKPGLFFPCPRPKLSSTSHNTPVLPRLLPPLKGLHISADVSLPKKPSKPPNLPILPPHDPHATFRDKLLFLDSIGIDLFLLTTAHPPIVSSSLDDIRSTVDFLRSTGFTSPDLRRICGMCPEVLTTSPANLTPVFTFLLREAGVQGSDLRRVVNRRPRLLVSDVDARLRPTLYFLQMLGIADISKHVPLLTCSVEGKMLPRMEYLQSAGFSPRDSRSMVRRFPQIFCYSIEGNLKPKMDYLVVEMGRGLRELKEFPHYFSFSLEDRIRRRHLMCQEMGVALTLPAMLKPGDEQFSVRLEVCVSSSPPLRSSPLWHENLNTKL